VPGTPASPHLIPGHHSPPPAHGPPSPQCAAGSVPARRSGLYAPFFHPSQHRRGAVSQDPPDGAQAAALSAHPQGPLPDFRPRPAAAPSGAWRRPQSPQR